MLEKRLTVHVHTFDGSVIRLKVSRGCAEEWCHLEIHMREGFSTLVCRQSDDLNTKISIMQT